MLRQALSELNGELLPDVILSDRCDELTPDGMYNNVGLLQLDALDARSRTLAVSAAMLHATKRSHEILDDHYSNASMESTLLKLEDAWKPVCRHLDCDHTKLGHGSNSFRRFVDFG